MKEVSYENAPTRAKMSLSTLPAPTAAGAAAAVAFGSVPQRSSGAVGTSAPPTSYAVPASAVRHMERRGETRRDETRRRVVGECTRCCPPQASK